MARIASTTTAGVQLPGGGMTLDALMARQKELAGAAGDISAPRQIGSPWQAAAQLAQSFVNARQQSYAADQLGQGRQALAQLIGGVNPETGATQEQIAQMGILDPEAAQRAQETVAQIIRDRKAQEAANANREDTQSFEAGQTDKTIGAQASEAEKTRQQQTGLETQRETADAAAAKLKREQELQDPTSSQGKIMRDFTGGLYGDPATPEAAARRDAALAKENDTTGGAGPDAAFGKAVAGKQAESFSKLADSGVAAAQDEISVGQLEKLLGSTTTGTGAGMRLWAKQNLGVELGDDVSDLQAATAIINKLAPANREAGSGPLSDRDMAMLIQSLPSIWNQPGGNAKILNTMKGLIEYRKRQGTIAAQVMNGDMTRRDGMAALQAIPNPLEEYRLPDGVSEDDITATMAAHGWTREQVLAKLKGGANGGS